MKYQWFLLVGCSAILLSCATYIHRTPAGQSVAGEPQKNRCTMVVKDGSDKKIEVDVDVPKGSEIDSCPATIIYRRTQDPLETQRQIAYIATINDKPNVCEYRTLNVFGAPTLAFYCPRR